MHDRRKNPRTGGLGRVVGRRHGARRARSKKKRNDNQLSLNFSSAQHQEERRAEKIRKHKKNRSTKQGWLKKYVAMHIRACQEARRKIYHSISATVATLMVIGIVISLPSSLYVFLKNAESATEGWPELAQISLYLHHHVSKRQATELVNQLEAREEFLSVDFVSPNEGLRDFQKETGLVQILEHLEKNPLPAVIVLTPKEGYATSTSLRLLAEEFQSHRKVMHTKLDYQWVQRLWAGIRLIEASVWVLVVLFAFTVLFVLGNTIRLLVEDQRKEIELMKLIGGTHRAIRRPFLYLGVFLGGVSGVIAFFIVTAMLWVLQGPTNHFFSQFLIRFNLSRLSLGETIIMVMAGSLLGYLGAWAASTWYLRKINPE